MMYLVMEVGIGKTLTTIMDKGRPTDLTEHGVVLVYTNNSKSEVLTAYLATVDRASAMWHQSIEEHGCTFPRTYIDHIERINMVHRKKVMDIDRQHGYHD
jgi:hypothetical protein